MNSFSLLSSSWKQGGGGGGDDGDMESGRSFVDRGREQLDIARKHEIDSTHQKWICIAILILLVMILIIALPVVLG